MLKFSLQVTSWYCVFNTADLHICIIGLLVIGARNLTKPNETELWQNFTDRDETLICTEKVYFIKKCA